ncbi:MAG TPA: hypothetical protein VGL89_07410 [Candidatus Koribacter sp.]|jgi:hypothetical protein
MTRSEQLRKLHRRLHCVEKAITALLTLDREDPLNSKARDRRNAIENVAIPRSRKEERPPSSPIYNILEFRAKGRGMAGMKESIVSGLEPQL